MGKVTSFSSSSLGSYNSLSLFPLAVQHPPPSPLTPQTNSSDPFLPHPIFPSLLSNVGVSFFLSFSFSFLFFFLLS